jgi:hypothetical protein
MRRLLPLALALTACGGGNGSGEGGRGVLVIAIDGMRYDHTSLADWVNDTTPRLRELAEEGVVYENAWSAAPWSLPSHASILTGCDPLVSQRILPPEFPPATHLRWHVPDAAPSLAVEFLRAGWTTAAFSDHLWIGRSFGFARGFGTFVDRGTTAAGEASAVGIEGISNEFLAWLGERDRGENWFAYLHVGDVLRTWQNEHAAWDRRFPVRPGLDRLPPVAEAGNVFFAVPRTSWSGELRTLGEYEAVYDGALARIDDQLSRLFAKLEVRGLWERTTVVVVGTHGMDLGEAGLVLDSGTYADTDIHVPLVIRPAATRLGAPRGARRAEVVGTADLAPTLLEYVGLTAPEAMHGTSFLGSLLRGEPTRGHALSCCGLQGGFAVVDAERCYEHVFPTEMGDARLRQSWFGWPQPRLAPADPPVRRVLHRRASEPVSAHLEELAPGDPGAADLERIGLEQVERALRDQQAWQPRDWSFGAFESTVPAARSPEAASPPDGSE